MDGPTRFFAVHTSDIIVSNWSAGSTFTHGPPDEDVQFKSEPPKDYQLSLEPDQL